MNIDDNKNLKESIECNELCFGYDSSSDKEEEDLITNEGKFSESMEMSNYSYKIQEVEKKLNELSYDDMWGIEFDNVDQCCDFYRNYAEVHDFVARLDEKGQDFSGNLNMRQMVCNREGTHRKKYLEMENRKKDHKPITRYRTNELLSDFKSLFTTPVLTTCLQDIEKQAADIFTRSMFKEVRCEIEEAGKLNVVTHSVSNNEVKVRINKYRQPGRECEVQYDKVTKKFACDCRLFESRGIRCCHIFCTMRHDHIDIIPDTLVCTRWTKNTKKDYVCSVTSAETDSENIAGIRYGALVTLCFTLCESASKNRDDFMEIRDDIFGLIQKLKKRRDPDSNVLSNACMVGDPTVVKTKGVLRQNRWAIKSRKCSHCIRRGHTIRRCPELYSRDVLHTGHHQSSDELNDEKSYFEEEINYQSNDESNDTRVDDTSLKSKKYKQIKSGQPNNHDTNKICQPNLIDPMKLQNQHLNGLSMYSTFPEFSIPLYHPYNETPLYQSYSPYYYNVPNENLFWNGEVHNLNENRKQ
ncbi:hypothetical protein Ahy_A04g018592 [Arachis hypogaea]|uniref:Protein FAR1-RELATED SEQUENCE n=1 Tax=Arachis hypogaea TaxID=3818 RepID=A0A445DE25_ARAHY|nr:hypothetical protein Ahy_A04g018592 [Arachis hypogaea]